MNPSRIRVLWLTENYPPGRGGMAESCDRIVHSLRALGVWIDVVHLCRHGSAKVERKQQGRYIAYPMEGDPPHALRCLWSLLSALHQESPATHVLAFGGALPLLAGPVYAAWLQRPLITLLRGNDFDLGVFTERRCDVVREAVVQAACVCVVSRDMADKVATLYPGTRPAFIPNGIDLPAWAALPSDRQRAAALRAATVAPGRRVIGMFGHIKPKKGGLFFLEALLKSGHAEQFHLLIQGEVEEPVVTWLQQQKPAVAYSLLPFCERYELLSRYPACDLVTIPSYYDGLPNVLLEAAASGVPLLASTAGGMADWLRDGEHAFLFHPGDATACAAAIARAAAASDSDLQRMAAACRTLAAGLTHHAEAERYLAALQKSAPATAP